MHPHVVSTMERSALCVKPSRPVSGNMWPVSLCGCVEYKQSSVMPAAWLYGLSTARNYPMSMVKIVDFLFLLGRLCVVISTRGWVYADMLWCCLCVNDRSLPGVESGVRVGILTFGAAIQFYKIHKNNNNSANIHAGMATHTCDVCVCDCLFDVNELCWCLCVQGNQAPQTASTSTRAWTPATPVWAVPTTG
jgi:hypothetical protein